MSSILRAMVLVLLVAACGGGNNTAPRNLDDACSIVKQRPTYLRAMKKAESRWGVPVHVQMATIYQESKFIGNARPPMRYVLGVIPMGRASSAYGFSQALDSTWNDYKSGPGRRGADRDNINDATDFMGWYMNDSTKKLGISKHDTLSQYLAYHEGRTGFANKTYRSKPWLMKVASEVAARGDMYHRQLKSCRKI